MRDVPQAAHRGFAASADPGGAFTVAFHARRTA